ncbi:unnamed protein product [Lactuca saligna]|uniref:Uncharacterized protein n=1 Tax=Lactuca saligna TaxID=75948 RepID=A0AA36A1B8_LACSI|nr:unnamed protein product [Lactuca saligna]
MKVKRDVATMKRFMALDDGDDMVVDDTPPNSTGDNHPPSQPPLINIPPPSHLRTHSPPPNSPPQSDAAKKGGKPKVELLMQIVVAEIPNIDAATDQPILDTGDQSETNNYEGFLDLGFI